MRLPRFFMLIFGAMVLVTGTVLTFTHQQSADGLWKIVFTEYVDERWFYVEVLPTRIAMKSPTTLSGDLEWSPNNDWVGFLSREPSKGFYLARPDGSQHRLVIDIQDRYYSTIGWSPDGEWIYYIDNVFKIGDDLFRRRIADGYEDSFGFRSSVCCVQWSKDGEWLVVGQIVADSQRAIVRLQPDNSDQLILFQTTDRTLFHNNHDVFSLGFAGHDEWIILRVQDGSRDDSIYRIRPNGTDRQLIATVPEDTYTMSISHDGEWILYYYQSGSNFRQLMRLSIDGTRHEPYLEYDSLLASGIVHGNWSPDDSKLIFLAVYHDDVWLFEYITETGAVNRVYQRQSEYGIFPHFLPITFTDWDGGLWIVGVCIIAFSFMFLKRR